MASGTIFDPLRLLRVAPLMASTGTLVYAISELNSQSAFLQPTLREKSDALLPQWYSRVFNRGVWVVLVFNLTTASTTAVNLWLEHRGSAPSLSTKFYWAGLVAAIGHLGFIPWVATPVQNIVEDSSKEGATSEMGKWLGVHRVRMALADVPAWLSFIGAVLTSASL